MHFVSDQDEEESCELLPREVRAVPVHGVRPMMQTARSTRDALLVEMNCTPNEEESVELLLREVPAVPVEGDQGKRGLPEEKPADRENFTDCVMGAVNLNELMHIFGHVIAMMIIDVLALMLWGGEVMALLIVLQVLLGVMLAVRLLMRKPISPIPAPAPAPAPVVHDSITDEIMNRRQWVISKNDAAEPRAVEGDV